LLHAETTLENHFSDMQDMEFTIQEGKLWMLQTRNGKRTGAAMVRIAMEMLKQGMIDEKTALQRVAPDRLNELLHPIFDPRALKAASAIARGLPASPGAATGQIVFFADEAETWFKAGKDVILVRQETSPEDLRGMSVAKGILTARGGMTSHAAVVARGMGKCCVSGAGCRACGPESPHHDRGRHGLQRGRLDLAQRLHRRGLCGQDRHQGRRAERRLWRADGLDRQIQTPGNPRQRRQPGGCQGGPQLWRHRHRPVPHRAHVF
jgi:phosphohistidine swiveling domain-containing protein